MLYTIMPTEEVLQGFEDPPAALMEVELGGVMMEIEPVGSFQGKVVRVISSDPEDYLNPQFQPGNILRWA